MILYTIFPMETITIYEFSLFLFEKSGKYDILSLNSAITDLVSVIIDFSLLSRCV